MLTILGKNQSFCDGVSRRNFLKVGALGMGGMGLADLLRAESQSGIRNGHKAIIMIYLPGGPSHTDMYDIKENAPKEFRGDFSAISTKVPGVRICEHLPNVAANFDKFVALRTVVGQADDHSSFSCMTGRNKREQQPPGGWPSIGSTLSKLKGQGLYGTPPYVAVSGSSAGMPGFLGGANAAFSPSGRGRADMTLNGVTLDRLDDRKSLLSSFDTFRRDVDGSGKMTGIDAFNDQAFDVITSSKMLKALESSKEPAQSAKRYEANKGRRLTDFLVARRLVEAGARFVTLNFGGWDSHSNNFRTLSSQLPELDRGVSAIVQDLHERGMEKDVTVVVWGEFGRTPRVNMNSGRDHWSRVMGALIAGGGMKTGQAIGETDRVGGEPASRPVHIAEVFATLYNNVGIDANKTTVQDLSGRPQHLVSHGYGPIRELI